MAVGYDVLGCCIQGLGDRVTVELLDRPEVVVGSVTGLPMDLPTDPEANTATAGLVALVREHDLDAGFRVSLDKGIPLGSGLGGSAASAVGAVVAANALLGDRFTTDDLLRYALLGEAVASEAIHPDNVAPCLYGGLVLTREVAPPDVIDVPVPETIRCVLVRPEQVLETREARSKVPPALPVADVTRQTAHLGAFVAGCYRNDLALIGRSLRDLIVEPHRAPMVPGFHDVQQAALDAGALGCSLSGAGPTLFAWADGDARARAIQSAMQTAFSTHNTSSDAWISPVNPNGAGTIGGIR